VLNYKTTAHTILYSDDFAISTYLFKVISRGARFQIPSLIMRRPRYQQQHKNDKRHSNHGPIIFYRTGSPVRKVAVGYWSKPFRINDRQYTRRYIFPRSLKLVSYVLLVHTLFSPEWNCTSHRADFVSFCKEPCQHRFIVSLIIRCNNDLHLCLPLAKLFNLFESIWGEQSCSF
jgi:hypothetical protein